MIYHVARITWDCPTQRCCLCRKGFKAGAIYARAENGKMAHYKCAQKHHWKRESRKKKLPPKLEFAPVSRPIKIVRAVDRGRPAKLQ